LEAKMHWWLRIRVFGCKEIELRRLPVQQKR
jgi:hypothetical protein